MDLEIDYFNQIKYESSLLFGGSLGSKPGGVSALALTPNGRLIAAALTAGAILIYDTRDFELVRIFFTQEKIVQLEFSKDNYS